MNYITNKYLNISGTNVEEMDDQGGPSNELGILQKIRSNISSTRKLPKCNNFRNNFRSNMPYS